MSKHKQEVAELVAADPFLETANKAAGWVERHVRLILLLLLGVALLIGLYLAFGAQKTRGAAVVTSELSAAVELYRDSIDQAGTATTTEAKEAGLKEALPKFEALISGNAGLGAAQLGHLYAGDLNRRLGHHDEAEKHFSAYASSAPKGDTMLYVALEGAGYAAEEQGEQDRALDYFTKLGQLPDGFYKDYALKHQARVLEAKGDKDGAIAKYRAILDEMAESKLRDFAEQRLEALGAKAAAGKE